MSETNMDIMDPKKLLALGSVFQIVRNIKIIFSYLSVKRKSQIFLLLALQIVSGFSEILSLGSLLPFISALSNASALMQRPEIQPFIEILNITSQTELIAYSSALFITAFVLVNCLRVFTFWAQTRMGAAIGNDLNGQFFNTVLHQNFEYHLNINSGVLISRSFVDLNGLLNFITCSLMISTQSFTILAIAAAVLFYDPAAAAVIFFSVLILYFIIASINKKTLLNNGLSVSNNRATAVQNLQIGLGGIRDVLLGHKQEVFVKRYSSADYAFRKASAISLFLRLAPRYILEIVGVAVLVSFAAYYATTRGDLFGVLPLIGALAMATMRMLPAAQMIYNAYAQMQSVHISVERVLDILKLPIISDKILPENDIPAPQTSIDLSDVWFRFNSEGETPSNWILKGINLSLPINKTIALVGKTGSGKTTISDIVSGLLRAEKGQLSVDGKEITSDNLSNWRTHVASVPQSIFLIDTSVKENVAFGVPAKNIDMDKVKQACKLAQIDDLIENRPQQYDEVIGENGLRLSGGQRQRIGIARALYKDASLIVLDEATSALDNTTEETVMETIAGLHGQRTILIIAHRLDTIKKADLIYEIEDGKVIAKGTYDELMNQSDTFKKNALAGK